MNLNKALFYALAAVVGFLGGIGDLFFTNWAQKDRIAHLIIGMFVCNVALAFFAYSLKKGTLVETCIIYSIVSDVVILAGSKFYFHEPLSNMAYVGAAVVMVGVTIMSFGK